MKKEVSFSNETCVQYYIKSQTVLSLKESCFCWHSIFKSSLKEANDKEILLISLVWSGTLLRGRIRVKNNCFEKDVHVRYTVNYWKTYLNVNATYERSYDKDFDIFGFTIDLVGNLEHRSSNLTIFYALCLIDEIGTFWDNNDRLNYELSIEKRIYPVSFINIQETDEMPKDNENYKLLSLEENIGFVDRYPGQLNLIPKSKNDANDKSPGKKKISRSKYISKSNNHGMESVKSLEQWKATTSINYDGVRPKLEDYLAMNSLDFGGTLYEAMKYTSEPSLR